MQQCPVDCEQEDWQPWSSCSLTCGAATGTTYRRRNLISMAAFGGMPCDGNMEEHSDCRPPEPCKAKAPEVIAETQFIYKDELHGWTSVSDSGMCKPLTVSQRALQGGDDGPDVWYFFIQILSASSNY